jgi:hypothetical protein
MNDKHKFNEGDRVLVYLTTALFDGCGSLLDAEFVSGPQGPGDTFHLRVNGDEMLLNGNSSVFICMVKVPSPHPC